MAECSVPPDAAFEESAVLRALLRKLLFLPLFAVVGTDAGVEGVVEDVARLVAHWHQLRLDVGRWVFEVLPVDLSWWEYYQIPGNVHGVLL